MKIAYVAKRLRHYRKIRNWSVQELSKGSAVSERQIESIEEEAVKAVHPLILEKLANALLIDLQLLLEESNPPELPPEMPGIYESISDFIAAIIALFGFAVACCLLLYILVWIF